MVHKMTGKRNTINVVIDFMHIHHHSFLLNIRDVLRTLITIKHELRHPKVQLPTNTYTNEQKCTIMLGNSRKYIDV